MGWGEAVRLLPKLWEIIQADAKAPRATHFRPTVASDDDENFLQAFQALLAKEEIYTEVNWNNGRLVMKQLDMVTYGDPNDYAMIQHMLDNLWGSHSCLHLISQPSVHAEDFFKQSGYLPALTGGADTRLKWVRSFPPPKMPE